MSQREILRIECDRCGKTDDITNGSAAKGWRLFYSFRSDESKRLESAKDICPACSTSLNEWFNAYRPLDKKPLHPPTSDDLMEPIAEGPPEKKALKVKAPKLKG